ncbi:MAG: hypothetical protein JST11_10350 [Acidobacteria bacterium]|nr:hypothetical protein [Acidobacteriota bacterium]
MRLAILLATAVSAYAAGVTANPPVVNWSYVSGSHNYPSATVALTSATGASSYSAVANSDTGWLLVNSAYASSAADLSLGAYLLTTVPIERLGNGVYQGTVNITDSDGNTGTITVNLTITGVVTPPPVLAVSPAALSFTSVFGGPAQSQPVTVTGPTAPPLAVQPPAGTLPPWLQTAIAGAAGSYTVTVTVTPAGLVAGTYQASLIFTIGSSSVTVPVSLTVQAQSNLTVSPAALSFDCTLGEVCVPKQVVVNSANGVAVSFSASAIVQTGNWLQVQVNRQTTPNGAITVGVFGWEALAPGYYGGSVIVTPLSQAATLSVPVGLTVHPAPVIAVSSGSLSFSYRVGGTAPIPLNVQVTGGGSNPNFTVQVTGGSWLQVTPLAGRTPNYLAVSIAPGGLAPGTYNATITVSGAGTTTGTAAIAVALTVLPASPAIARVMNAAGYQEGGIAPGEMVTLFGSGLAPAGLAGLALDDSGNVATTLNGVQVLFNGMAAPLVFTTPGQLAAVAPYELAGAATAAVQVVWNGQASNTVQVPVVAALPGIFTANASGTGPAAALSGPGFVTLYLTGEGQTIPAGVTGKVTTVSATPPLTPAPALPVSVMLGGQPADFSFAGEAPGVVSGVLQLNVTVPKGMAPGIYPIVVTIGGKPTQSGVTVQVM